MSNARDVNMAKIAANVEDEAHLVEEAENDSELSPKERIANAKASKEESRLEHESLINAERLKQEQLKTQMHINRLEKAKEAATSDAVKEKLQQEIDDAKRRKEEYEAKRKEELKTVRTATQIASTAAQVNSSVSQAASKTVDRVQDTIGNVKGTLETISTPGSIFLPIAVLIIFFFLLLPVNGHTRAQWLWMSLIGDAQVAPSGTNNQDTGSGQGGGGQPQTSPVTAGSRDFYGVQYG